MAVLVVAARKVGGGSSGRLAGQRRIFLGRPVSMRGVGARATAAVARAPAPCLVIDHDAPGTQHVPDAVRLGEIVAASCPLPVHEEIVDHVPWRQ